MPLPAKDERMSKTPDNALTIDELSAYLKIPKSSLYKLAQEGKLPGQKVGRHWRFHRAAIDKRLGQRAKNTETERRNERCETIPGAAKVRIDDRNPLRADRHWTDAAGSSTLERETKPKNSPLRRAGTCWRNASLG